MALFWQYIGYTDNLSMTSMRLYFAYNKMLNPRCSIDRLSLVIQAPESNKKDACRIM